MARRLGVLAFAAVLAVFAGAPAASAPDRESELRPGVGVGSIRLGMTLAQVRGILGKPDRVVRRERHGFAPYTEYAWGLTSDWTVGVHGRGAAARVVALGTTRPERTRQGVGVGSTHDALQRLLGAACRKPPPSPYGGPDELPGYPLQIACYVGPRGGALTAFRLANDCQVPTDRHQLCPKSKRRYVAYEVWLFSPLGRRILFRQDPRTGPWIPVQMLDRKMNQGA